MFSVAPGLEAGLEAMPVAHDFVVEQDLGQPDMCSAAADDQFNETMIQRMDGSSKDPCKSTLAWCVVGPAVGPEASQLDATGKDQVKFAGYFQDDAVLATAAIDGTMADREFGFMHGRWERLTECSFMTVGESIG